ncbi:hypothetical protein CKA32_000180 [Geitlerinema sp. FC II]|nr:hypothetical protein CKA32_000180 [Geitlerinema sp. FC II]
MARRVLTASRTLKLLVRAFDVRDGCASGSRRLSNRFALWRAIALYSAFLYVL